VVAFHRGGCGKPSGDRVNSTIKFLETVDLIELSIQSCGKNDWPPLIVSKLSRRRY